MATAAPPRPAARTHRAAPRRPAAARPAAVLCLIVAGALGVLALWWSDTPVVAGAAAWLTGAGRITGLLAGYAAPVLLLLMARLPLLERGVGADRLARWHAFGGRWLVALVTVHVLSIVWGYALTDGRGLLGEGVELVFHYPEMLKASLATLLMLGTGAVSARAARRRFSYEAWYYLHLATYLAVALAFGHQLATGADLGDGPARAAWYALYLGTAALLGWYRLARPWLLDRRHRLRVAEVRPEGPGVVSLFLTGRRLDELRAEPGQFFRLQFQAPGLRWAANPYSLSAPPRPDFLRFTVKDLGGHSAAVAALRPGTPVRAEGPYGAFTGRLQRRRRVLLLGAGVGITPLRALFETLPGELTLVQRAGRPEDVLFRAELAEVARRRGAVVHELVGPRERIGDLGTALARLVPDLAEHEVYLCGPDPLAEEAVRSLRAAGVRAGRIHRESFVL
ncbi:ferredoxin-NADP reductase/DMSO/TMAO reductase YedYZ heme-binding membrane subunit [Kitasatospora sp. MAA19]|uniref:ferredoxin reductase family protein n=1 Tax=Kitasatospora sp. MAA19 TaxID=3035090 RepID=UPI002473AEB8|nr:ferredoxin reductase family protein [Kitasatospora sp. MAA19]MDH6707916.1 ferredoxin-NADP reductase/DMSO/TMAO reductase YedYZ heme-binding membrane subunit [Kitasatospora sp. MAA19]